MPYNINDPFAAGGRQDDDDQVRALFGQWLEFRRAADRASEAEDDAEGERLLDEADAVQAQIILAGPSAIGLAAKAYMFLHMDFFNNHEGAAIAPGELFEGEMHPSGDAAFATAMIRDAATFLPELRPLVEPVLAAARNASIRANDDAETAATLRPRCEALIAEYRAPLPDGDAGLIAAERRLIELEPRREAFQDSSIEITTEIEEEIINPLFDAKCELDKRIAVTPAATLAGAAVKLRRLLDLEVGLPAGDQEGDVPCLHQILAVI